MNKSSFKDFFTNKIATPFKKILKQGISPKKLGIAFTIGIVYGIIPIPGISTWLCLGTGLLLSVNKPTMLFANYLATPIQIITIIPFYKLGETIANVKFSGLIMEEIINGNFLIVLEEPVKILSIFLFGVIAWAIFCIPLGGLAYLIFKYIFKIVLTNKVISKQ
ncbi:MAG: DUF2062 domain-containing protein [Hyphomicrobiales bacterium]